MAVTLYKTLIRNDLVSLPKPSSVGSTKKTRYRRVIIGMVRANISSNFLDLYLYRALKNNGIGVKVLLCDGSIFPCDAIAGDSNIFNYRCLECKATQQHLAEVIEAPDIIRPKRLQSVTTKQPNINAIASARRFDKSESNYDERIAIKYQMTYDSIKNRLHAERHVDLVVMSHGMYASWGAIREYCEENAIDYITWGRSYFEKMVAVVKNSTINEGISQQYADLASEHPEELRRLVRSIDARISNRRASRDTVDYYAYLKDDTETPDPVAHAIRSHPNKVAAVFLSIPWDGTVYGANGEFRGQREFIRQIVLNARENPQILYVFRAHPMEHKENEKAADQIRAMSGQQLKNVIVIDAHSKLTSYELMTLVDLNIVYSGTLALEIAHAGLPLLVCGKNLTSNFPGIRTISTHDELKAIWKTDRSTFIPRNVDILFKNLSKVLYVDDLSNSNGFDITSFNENSQLTHRIMDDLIYEL